MKLITKGELMYVRDAVQSVLEEEDYCIEDLEESLELLEAILYSEEEVTHE